MDNYNMQQNQQIQDVEEIDIVEIIVRLWKKKRFVLKVTGVFMVLGLLVGIFSPIEFTSECVMVPQTTSVSTSASGSIGSLAQLAGISLGNIGNEETLSPAVYENILKNIRLNKELIYTKFYFEEYGREISLYDYYTLEEYEKFSLAKYTIGLPGLILKSLRGEPKDNPALSRSGQTIDFYTRKEMECVERLEDSILLDVNEKSNYVSISATMPDALLSAMLVNRIQELLQKYITAFKIEKAEAGYQFIKERYDEAKADYEQKQVMYAKFKDANKLLTSATSQIKEIALQTDYEIASSTLSELTAQLIQAEIKVKEDTPNFTIIEPTKVPTRRSAPKRSLILIAFIFLGGMIGCGLVLLFDTMKESLTVEMKFLEKWEL